MSLALMNLSLARAHLDRAAHLRTDEAALEALFSKGKVFQVHQGKFLFTQTLHWLDPTSAPEGDHYFLGLDGSGIGYFAINAPFPEGTENLQTLREAGLVASEIVIGMTRTPTALGVAHIHTAHLPDLFDVVVPMKASTIREQIAR
jgi:NAD+ diphosphatase